MESATKGVPSSSSSEDGLESTARLHDVTAGDDDLQKTGQSSIGVVDAATKPKRGLQFWMCVLAIVICSFLMALDLSGVSTALPIIVRDLNGTQFEWVGSAYALAGTALMPLSGGLAQVFGRRSIMLIQIVFFALGSALCGAAKSVNFLIAGRTIQGIGAGGIMSLTQIILSDIVPLQERGTFNGLVGVGFAFATAIAPVIAGALAEHGQWRWFFYLNLPICGVCAALVFVYLQLKVPHGTFKEKIFSLDWTGNTLVVGGTTAVVIALTWGGIEFPWNSWHVLVPLIVGIAILVAFMAYEGIVPKQPLVPLRVLSTFTGISGYIQTALCQFLMLGLIYYLPVYFQGCKDKSPISAGLDMFSLAYTIVPAGIVGGISVAKTGRYRPQLWLAWVLLLISTGLLSTLKADTPLVGSIGYSVIGGFGLGILMSVTYYPVLAPLPLSMNASAVAFFMFVRFFAQVWGVTVGGTVLQNELTKKLPAEFIQQFPAGTQVAYSIIPLVKGLPQPFKQEVQNAFAESLKPYWQILIGVSGIGFLSCFAMKGLPLHNNLDEDWGLQEKDKSPQTKVEMESLQREAA